MKKKLILALLLVIVIGGFVVFYQCYLGDYLLQSKFALKTPIVTGQGDKFNYTWETKEYDAFVGAFVGTGITYKIYHYKENQWQKIMECGGEYNGDQDIKISNSYEDKNVIVYKIWQYIKGSTANQYLLIDKSNSKAADLSSKLQYAYSDMTKEQIRNDKLLNQAKAFILNYKLPEDADYNHYIGSFEKIRDAFQKK